MKMLSLIQILIICFSLIDLTLTYMYLNQFHRMYPDKDHTQLEANPILKFGIQEFGLEKGMILGGLVVFGLVLLLVFQADEKLLYFIGGALAMMNVYHYLNWIVLRNTGL